jgi:hypothetical protein
MAGSIVTAAAQLLQSKTDSPLSEESLVDDCGNTDGIEHYFKTVESRLRQKKESHVYFLRIFYACVCGKS